MPRHEKKYKKIWDPGVISREKKGKIQKITGKDEIFYVIVGDPLCAYNIYCSSEKCM